MKRIFLACTPRTGNVWFRKMLAASIGCSESSAHSPDEVAWPTLPSECVVAMHWHYSREFAGFLSSHALVPLVTVRHPLDVLISVLHFSQHEPSTARWLCGEHGDECRLMNTNPTSPEFLEYALSDRAAALLAISMEWLVHAVAVVRYEDLVAQPESVLGAVLEKIGCKSEAPLADIVAAHTLARLKPLAIHHFWRGEPGLWRKVLTRDFRAAIVERHAQVFETLGYDCSSSIAVPSREAALSAWNMLCSPASAALQHQSTLSSPAVSFIAAEILRESSV